jgi:hypothetical protein
MDDVIQWVKDGDGVRRFSPHGGSSSSMNLPEPYCSLRADSARIESLLNSINQHHESVDSALILTYQVLGIVHDCATAVAWHFKVEVLLSLGHLNAGWSVSQHQSCGIAMSRSIERSEEVKPTEGRRPPLERRGLVC